MASYIPHSRPTLGEEEARAAGEAIRSGQVAQGGRVAEFEAELASYLGRTEAVAVSSGLAALHLALVAIRVKPRDAVVVPSYNCAALVQAVRHCGAEVRLCDVDPVTGNPTPETVASAAEGARAVVVTHLFGAPAEAQDIAALGLAVVEDLAQGLGARSAEGTAGQFGQAAVCSFYATKLLTSGGEGGMILGDDRDVLARARDARSYDGRDDLSPRWNYKLTDLQAAVGLAQLSRYEEFIRRRRAIAMRYNEHLADTPLRLPEEPPGGRHVFHRYVVGLPEDWVDEHGDDGPEKAAEELEKRGVGACRPIYKPLHRLTGESGFPGTDGAWRGHLSLPIYPSLTEGEVEIVVEAVRSLFSGGGAR
ncbi:DegT/DnrJ/EryC1/StrS family aminotransferase [Nitrospinota bacterium]